MTTFLSQSFFRDVQPTPPVLTLPTPPPLPPPPSSTTTTTRGINTCGYRPYPVTTLRFPTDKLVPLICADPKWECSTSGSYKGCPTPMPTRCVETSTSTGTCDPGAICCGGTGPATLCFTFYSALQTSTFTLFYCSSVGGTGTLMADSTTAAGPGPGPVTSPSTDAAVTVTLPGAGTTPAGTIPLTGADRATTSVAMVTETKLAIPGPTSEAAESGGASSTSAVVGSVVGAVAFVGMILGAALFIWARSRRKRKRREEATPGQTDAIRSVTGPDGIIVVPYGSGTTPAPAPAPAQAKYAGRVSRWSADTVVPAAKWTMPKRPARSPERKMNVTEGGWL
ncbi:hypothetical protein CTA2_10071 [Colletotrichum tanaceti]|uniref:Uncharacterized protein n=1 Tax=Colletotrichum tanaceti TaxID=1306861 RepID=A0A4U6XR17_9PEZI|nr:hypothetical protein CTA2_10071 [Colletotrichum tanaceti]TKW58242.1 hypothetical protein CTA1_7557 [Colletotrichum tanaceti]